MGRAHQVREIITRLEAARFVAVVGGSGCGKSSIIRAGVVPRLRGFGIPGEGDYWVPIVCTPGTVRVSTNAAAGVPLGSEESAITRLARRIAQSLEPSTTKEEEISRRDEIATSFRQGGFARVVETYSDELKKAGPDGRQARFVFVIDQFEELFHPNNHGNADAVTTIEAIISHFYNPHERSFVVLTMRSEHLADCAAYLELPDAINKSLYLVRRLNEHELREAIVGPAKYFLRLQQRAYEARGHLPEDVTFDERLIARLLQDVTLIANDADHLPLLQHLLARTWYTACQREQVAAGGVPSEVRWEDLERAVNPTTSQPARTVLDENSVNVLRSSLENWAEHIYGQRPRNEQTQIDEVLRRLAFRDPNSGLYFQQRLEVNAPARAGTGLPTHLQDLLQRGFLDTVNYLFWDDENPDRVTLKVSHEAFIRGWDRFRRLIDREAERFEEFLSVLRKCANWRAKGTPTKLLLGGSELASIEAAKLEDVLGVHDDRSSWFQRLLEYRDGPQLANVDADVDQFLAASRNREKWAQRMESVAVPALVTIVVLVLALSFFGLDWSVRANEETFTKAKDVANGARPGDDQAVLAGKIAGARLIERTKANTLSSWVERLQWVSPFSSFKERLESASASSEPEVNGSLRSLLTATVWAGTAQKGASSRASVQSPYKCRLGFFKGEDAHPGMLVRAAGDGSRTMFVGLGTKEYPFITFSGATLTGDGCATFDQPFYYDSWQEQQAQSAAVIDANLTYLAVVQKNARGKGATIFQLQWGLDPAYPRVDLQPLPPVIDAPGQPTAVEYIEDEVKGEKNGFKPVETWWARGGSVVKVGGKQWRLFAGTAVPLPAEGAVGEQKIVENWTRLQPSAPDSVCGIRRGGPGVSVGTKTFEHDSICFELGRQVQPGPKADATTQGAPVWVLTVFSSFEAARAADPTRAAAPGLINTGATGPRTLASFPFSTPAVDGLQLWIGKSDHEWDGWVGLQEPGKPLQVAPWATTALSSLGCEVLASELANKTLCATAGSR